MRKSSAQTMSLQSSIRQTAKRVKTTLLTTWPATAAGRILSIRLRLKDAEYVSMEGEVITSLH